MIILRPRGVASAALFAVSCVQLGCSSDDDVAQVRETLDWSPCPSSVGLGLDCATLEVPLDHEAPDGPTIEIALSRAAARKPSERIGALLLNPGGPGVPGLGLPALAAQTPLGETFDIIGFDPRGVGQSTPLDCQYTAPDPSADPIQGLQVSSQGLADACVANAGELVVQVGTTSVARDLDLIREALGEDRISYIGISYGTRIGAVYANLFPDRVRAMVLDAVDTPGRSLSTVLQDQAAAYEVALERFSSACDADPACPVEGPTLEAFDALLLQVLEEPLEVSPGVFVGGPDLLNLTSGLLREGEWIVLAYVIAALQSGNLEELGGGLPSASPEGYAGDAFVAVTCADYAERRSVEDVYATMLSNSESSPRFGAIFALAEAGCSYWPAAKEPVSIGATSASARMLLIGATYDPATPYADSLAMKDALGNAHHLSFDGDGHGTLAVADCPTEEAFRFLAEVSPPERTSCPSEGMPPVSLEDSPRVESVLPRHRLSGARFFRNGSAD
jgi:pimeloyl-ACP methyl ester carboxylesterase